MTTLSTEPDTIQQRFEAFDAAHPEVWHLFKRFADELRRAGRRHGSADQIIQRIRWETSVNPEHDGGFKIDDRFSSRYARKLMDEYEWFRGFFHTRKLRSA